MYQQTRKQTPMKQTNKQFCIQKRNKKNKQQQEKIVN